MLVASLAGDHEVSLLLALVGWWEVQDAQFQGSLPLVQD